MIRAARLFLALVLCTVPLSASAGTIEYLQDPVFQKLNADDPHPMDDLMGLASHGDVRAQYILGDLYAKGKGGLAKNYKASRQWFETSAKSGYFPSFIRLAALAKHDKDPVEAYQWYTLAIEHFSYGPAQKYAVRARNDLAAAYKMSRDQIRQAQNAAEQWKTAARKQAEAEKRQAEEKTRVEKAAPKESKAARPVPTTKKQRPPSPPPSVKENHYNE